MTVQKGRNIVIMQKMKWKNYLCYFFILILLGTAVTVKPSISKAEESDVNITLLGTADIHGRFMPWDYALDGANTSGSLTQLYTVIKKVRQENPNTILVDAGDTIQGNSVELFNDQPQSPMMVAMNAMGYDAWAFGNHEFNFGLDTLKKVSEQYKGKTLAGNICKVDVMVGVMHMGLENENGIPGTGVQDIANACPELSAIFAAHMHKLVKKEIVNGVIITEPDKYGTHISRIDLTFTKQDGKLVLKDKTATAIPVKNTDGTIVVSDPTLEDTLTPFHEYARGDANVVVAQLKGRNLVPENEIKGIPSVQIQETPLSDFFHEVMLYYSKADVVAHQIDNDNARLDVGPIKKKDIAYNYQYALGEITVYKVTGKDLKDYMEWAAGYFNSSRPGDVTVSFDKTRRASKYSTNDFFGGVKYEIDLTKPYGSRITNLRSIRTNKPIKTNDVMTLGMNAYRMEALQAKGGALEGRKFEQIWSSKQENAFGETGGTIRNLAITYLKEVKNGVYTPKVMHNWKITGVNTHSSEHKAVVDLVNKGILEIPKTEDGKYTNIASINTKDSITKEEIVAISQKANINPNQFKHIKTKGEFYKKLSRIVKKI